MGGLAACVYFEDSIEIPEVLEIYKANNWSSVDKPTELINALRNSHSLVTARVSRFFTYINNLCQET